MKLSDGGDPTSSAFLGALERLRGRLRLTGPGLPRRAQGLPVELSELLRASPRSPSCRSASSSSEP